LALRLATADPDFQDRFQALLASKREASADVDAVVRDIIEDVRANGDAALLSYTERFDRLKAASVAELTVTPEEIAAALEKIAPETLEALTLARDRIASHHQRQMPKDDIYTDAIGVSSARAGRRSRPSGSMCRAARRAIRVRC
jgi:histidinol dehydrogenase